MKALVTAYLWGAAPVLGGRLLLLTTIGRRTATARTCPVMWFPDGAEAWIVGAGNYGEEKVPGWYANLTANPDQVWVDVGGRRTRVRAEELTGLRRDECLQRHPALGAYQRAMQRTLPVLRITPA